MELLKPQWYLEPPFDYEYKQYILLGYLKSVEDSFLQKKLSPHLLHLEKIKNDLEKFYNEYKNIIESFNKQKYQYFQNNEILYPNDDNIKEIYDIVDFSLPQVESKIIMGYKIYKNNIQLLY
jgi:hypothetical protein